MALHLRVQYLFQRQNETSFAWTQNIHFFHKKYYSAILKKKTKLKRVLQPMLKRFILYHDGANPSSSQFPKPIVVIPKNCNLPPTVQCFEVVSDTKTSFYEQRTNCHSRQIASQQSVCLRHQSYPKGVKTQVHRKA